MASNTRWLSAESRSESSLSESDAACRFGGVTADLAATKPPRLRASSAITGLTSSSLIVALGATFCFFGV
eukprot:7391348-Prymnesium_polylepis.2